jgi:hypothetical protein
MADLPLFPFTTQEDWYGELSFLSADASQEAISLEGRTFEMPITPSAQGSSLIEPVRTLTMEAGGGLSLKIGAPNTIVFRVPRDVARAFARSEYTADVLEVVSGERHLFMPVRIRYSEPSGLLSFISRFVGVTVSFAARLQPIVSPVAITGRQGVAGNTIITGTVPPVPADGKNGDHFIEDRSASGLGRRMYGPKTGGAWPPTPWPIQVARYQDVPGLTGALQTVALTQTTVERTGPPDDLAPGQHRIEWNVAKGAPSLWMNRGGTIIDALTPDNSGWTAP